MGHEDLTMRQQQVLQYIRETVLDRGYPPSVREIGDALGLSSPSTVHSHLSSLVDAGVIRRDPTKPRALEVVESDSDYEVTAGPSRDIPLVGRIAAGSPILAAEHIDDVLRLPETLVGPGPVFLLDVKGDSMIDAGILDGDLVAIHSQDHARDGEIVAALIDDEEATVKRLRRSQGKVILEPANPSMEPMEFTEGVQIIGKVVSVLRRL